MENRNFTCPYCNQPTTITSPNYFEHWSKINLEKSTQGEVGLKFYSISCPNKECKKLWLKIELCEALKLDYTSWSKGNVIQSWQLLPESQAKVLPDYIPLPIQENYKEACRIRDLSPKASATLSRRCLQGMIRDFWKISKSKLVDEIAALEEKVDPLTWDAIDAVRKVGNIGAHMEKDIDTIIEVDPNEAQLLIELIEQLIEDWYVAKYEKEKRLIKIKELALTKEGQKKSNKE